MIPPGRRSFTRVRPSCGTIQRRVSCTLRESITGNFRTDTAYHGVVSPDRAAILPTIQLYPRLAYRFSDTAHIAVLSYRFQMHVKVNGSLAHTVLSISR